MWDMLADSAWADRLGWVLVHTLWQFALVAVFAVVLQKALRRCAAATRYWTLLAAMCVLVALPVVTWCLLGSSAKPAETVAVANSELPQATPRSKTTYDPPSPRVDRTVMKSIPAQSAEEFRAMPQPSSPRTEAGSAERVSLFPLVQGQIQSWLPGIVLVWFVGVFVAALRPLLSWCTVQRLRTVGVSSVEDSVKAILARTEARLGVARSVELLQSALVKAPVVVGYFRPAILLPLSVLTGLPESQLELILAHEVAHIRRHDYLINLIQTLVETLFFYHPGMWWLSREICRERENCCDDVAMSIGYSRADYGEALLAVARLHAASIPLSLAARGGSLLGRMRRIAGCEPAPRFAGGVSILGIILVLVAVVVGVTWKTAPATTESETTHATSATDAVAAANSEETDDPAGGDWKTGQTIEVQTIHAQTREPLPGVKLEFQYHGEGIDFQDVRVKTTDAQGRSQDTLPNLRPDAVRIYPSKPGFVPLRIYWGDDLPSPKRPKSVIIPLEPGTAWGGVIRDEQGNPVPGVTVTVHYWESRDGNWQPHRRANIDEVTTTGEDGRWRIDVMPADVIEDQVRIYVSHPDYVSDHLRRGWNPIPITQRPTLETLVAENAVMVMRKGGLIKGRVLDEGGEPVSGVSIYSEEDYWLGSRKPAAITGQDGSFQLANVSFSASRMNDPSPETMRAVRRREAALVVQAAGYTPELVHVAPDGSASPLEIVLKQGAAVAGRVTDENGEPVEGVDVSLGNWLGYRSRFDLSTKTDVEGKFRLADAPPDGALYSFHKQGYMAVQDLPMSPGGADPAGADGYEVMLQVPLRVVGSIVDGETMQRLAECTVTRGVEYDDGRAPEWQRGFGTKTITDGRYEFEFASQVFSWRVRVEAEGYMPAVSRVFRSGGADKGEVTYDFKLFKAGPLAGTVADPGGQPLAGAEVYLATNLLIVEDGKAASQSARQAPVTRTDEAGRFELPPEPEPFYLVVLHERGFAVIDEERFAADSTFRIEPWTAENRSFRAERRPFLQSGGSAADRETPVSLRLIDEQGNPVEGARVAANLSFHSRPNQFRPYESNWIYWSGAWSDRDGMARIGEQHLECVVARHAERGLVAMRSIRREEINQADVVTLTMRPQCKVVGRLTSKKLEELGRKLTWTNVYLHLADGRARPMSCSSQNGDYHFYVPPGTYRLNAYGTDTNDAWKTITVEPDQQELVVEPIDLPPTGLALLEGHPAPELREIAAWRNDGPVELSDLQGKVVILCFVMGWSGSRLHSPVPQLVSTYGNHLDEELAIVEVRVDTAHGLGSAVNLADRLGEVKSPFWEKRNLSVPIALAGQGIVPRESGEGLNCPVLSDYGIRGLPTSVLIDRDGRVVGRFDQRIDADQARLTALIQKK